MKYLLYQLLQNHIIQTKEVDEYIYAFNIIVLKFIHYVVIFTISIILDIFIETVIFLYSYSVIRNYVGGIHANNPLVCLGISMLYVVILKLILNININFILIFIFMLVVSWYWYKNYKKSLSRIKFTIHLLLINVITVFFYTLNQDMYINCIIYGYILNLFLFTSKKHYSPCNN